MSFSIPTYSDAPWLSVLMAIAFAACAGFVISSLVALANGLARVAPRQMWRQTQRHSVRISFVIGSVLLFSVVAVDRMFLGGGVRPTVVMDLKPWKGTSWWDKRDLLIAPGGDWIAVGRQPSLEGLNRPCEYVVYRRIRNRLKQSARFTNQSYSRPQFCPKHDAVLCCVNDEYRIVEPRTGDLIDRLSSPTHSDAIVAVQWLPSGELVTFEYNKDVESKDYHFGVWSFDGRNVRRQKTHRVFEPSALVAFGPNLKWMVEVDRSCQYGATVIRELPSGNVIFHTKLASVTRK